MIRLLALALLSTTVVLPAQTWNEIGDAGDLPDRIEHGEPEEIGVALDRAEGWCIPHRAVAQGPVAYVAEGDIGVVGEEPEQLPAETEQGGGQGEDQDVEQALAFFHRVAEA